MSSGDTYPNSLCARCDHVRVITSGKGSVFLMCRMSQHDAAFPKYPPQPVVRCPAFRTGHDERRE